VKGKHFATPAGLNVGHHRRRARVGGERHRRRALRDGAAPRSRDGTVPLVVATSAGSSLPLDFGVLTPIASVTPATYEFGTVYVGASRDGALTLKNVGLADLTVLERRPPSLCSPLTSPKAPFTLEPGAERQLTVTFKPVRQVDTYATLSIVTNDPLRPQCDDEPRGLRRRPARAHGPAEPAFLDSVR